MTAIDDTTFENLKRSSGEEFMGELIDTFMQDGTQRLSELHSSLKAQDADTFRRAAHTLKSNAATFGAAELAVLAKELEDLGRSANLQVGDRLAALERAYHEAVEELQRRRA